MISARTSASKSSAFSRMSQASEKASATIVSRTMFGPAMESLEPTMRNSNLLPVKANGLVRFLSVASLEKFGSMLTPVDILPPRIEEVAVPVSISCATTSSS